MDYKAKYCSIISSSIGLQCEIMQYLIASVQEWITKELFWKGHLKILDKRAKCYMQIQHTVSATRCVLVC